MRADELMEVFQYLDDDIIESVELIRRNHAPVKRFPYKQLAIAACVCLILTGIYAMPKFFFGSDGTADMAVQEDVNDGMESENVSIFLTIPDYHFEQEEGQIHYYNYTRSRQEADSKMEHSNDHSKPGDDFLTCTADVLPVYTGLNLSDAMFSMDNVDSFEQQISKITSYEIYGLYNTIDTKKATNLLEAGHYLNFNDHVPNAADKLTIQMVYLYEKESDLAIPYYYFSPSQTEMNINSGWFVPAISEDYITNMP